jgi:hypothetical protein
MQRFQSLVEEPLPPLAHDLTRHIQSLTDLRIPQPGRCQQHGLGANDFAVR